MNETPSFPLAVPAKIPAAFDPFSQSTFTKELANAPAASEALKDYLVDAAERGVLMLDILRERGNQQAEMASRPLATVLTFGHEILLSGKSLRRPIPANQLLARPRHPPAGGDDRSEEAAGRSGRSAGRTGAFGGPCQPLVASGADEIVWVGLRAESDHPVSSS